MPSSTSSARAIATRLCGGFQSGVTRRGLSRVQGSSLGTCVVCVALISGCRAAPEPVAEPQPAPVQAVQARATPAPAPVPVQPAPAPPKLEQHEVVADDGHRLAVWSKLPVAPRSSILLIHGRTWSSLPDFDLQVPGGPDRSLMDALASREFAVYAIDLRGYGKTPRDTSAFLTPDRATADVVQTLDWIAQRHPTLDKPALFGWSLGSMVAQLAAQVAPQALSDLVLYGYPRNPQKIVRAHDSNQPQTPARKPTTKAAAAEDFRLETYVHPQTVAAFSEAAVTSDPVRVDWRDMHQFHVLRPEMVTVPTLVIHGRHDPYAPIANQGRLFTALGTEDRRWVVVPHGDHAAHLEQGHGYFVDALVGFLRRTPVVEVDAGA